MPNANVEKIKASLLKEIKGVFCEGYCLYYKDDYYCGACPLNDTSNWLNRKKPIAREEKLRTVNFCDGCIHFRPLKERECRTCLHYLPSEDSDSGECSLYSDRAYSQYKCHDWKSKN